MDMTPTPSVNGLDDPDCPATENAEEKQKTVGENEDARAPNAVRGRRRGKEACIKCRLRKVRCDYYILGTPCTNCLHFNVPCVLYRKQTLLKKKYKCENTVPAEKPPPSFHQVLSGSPPKTVLEKSPPVPTPTSSLHEQYPNNSLPSTTLAEPVEPPKGWTEQARLKDYTDVPLPSYVRWDSDQLSPATIYSLRREGAMILPTRSLMNTLLESYIDMVHPQMPFLDLPKFLTPIVLGSQEPQISLLLLQAVLFAGSLYLAETRICTPETSKRQIQSTLLRRVKVLYEAEYEKDPLIVVQASLLMSLVKGTDMKTCKDGAFLLSTSVLTAQELVRSSSGSHLLKSHSFRCLWWSLFTRNSLLALHLSERPVTMLRAEHVEMPDISAFQTLRFRKGVAEPFPNSLLMQRPSLLSTLAEIFLCRLRLATLIYSILDTAKHIPEALLTGRGQNMTTQRDRLEERYAAQLGTWDFDLEKWWYSLPKQVPPSSLYGTEARAVEDLKSFHRAIPAGEYFRISNAIVEFWISRQTDCYSFKTLITKLKQEMICARLLDVMESLDETNLTRYVGNYGYAGIETALEGCLRSANFASNRRDPSWPFRFLKRYLDARKTTMDTTPFLDRLINRPAEGRSTAEEIGDEMRANNQDSRRMDEVARTADTGERSSWPSPTNVSLMSPYHSGLPFGYESVYGVGSSDESPNSPLFSSKTCTPEEDLFRYSHEVEGESAPQALAQKDTIKDLSVDPFIHGSASGWTLPELMEDGSFLDVIEEGTWPR